jgi:predicted nucleic acid-binding protein
MFIDTSIIIEILREEKSSKQFQNIYGIIKDEPLFISTIQLAELADWCLRTNSNLEERIAKIKQIATIIPLTETICVEAARLKQDMRTNKIAKFGILDGIVLASARSMNERLLTSDNDFRTLSDVIIV